MPDRKAWRISGREIWPPSRLWKPTRTGSLFGSAFCGAAVVVGAPSGAVVVAPAAAEADALVVAAAAVVAELLLLLSPPQAARPIRAAAATTAVRARVVLMLPLSRSPTPMGFRRGASSRRLLWPASHRAGVTGCSPKTTKARQPPQQLPGRRV